MRLRTAAWPLLLVWAIRHGGRSILLVALAANLLLAVTFGAPQAHACSCTGTASTPEEAVQEELQGSDAVFSGVVLEVDRSDLEVDRRDLTIGQGVSRLYALRLGTVTFDVEESWKGVSEEPVVVGGYGPGATCGIAFREGERYLVYASYSKQGEDDLLHTGACSKTKLLDRAGADLEALGPAELVLPETVVEPESVDSTPVSGIWSFSSERVVTAAMVTLLTFAVLTLLVLAAVGAFLFWRRRRPG